MTGRLGQQGRVAVIVLAAISAISVAAAVGSYAMKMQETQARQRTEKELVLVKSAKEAVENELRDIQAAKAKIETDYYNLKTEAQSLSAQIEEEKKGKEELARAVSDKQTEVSQLKQGLDQARNDSTSLNQQLARAQADLNELQKELQSVKEAKAALEEQTTQSAQQSVDLQKVVVNKSDGTALQGAMAPSGPNLSGQVLVVNREFDFVVVNLGKNNGMQVGQMFEVYRDNDVLGRVKVEKVYDALSACAIQPDAKKDQLREGDKVRSI